MNNLLLSEELIKQIKLIKYDRSKTVFEQKEIETSTQISDRLGNRGEYSASPEIFKDPSYIEYEKLSDKEKEKLQDEFLNKKWKSKLCTKTASQDRSVFDGEGYVSHENFCKDFGGTQIYKSSSSDILGQGYYCGCKYNGDVMIGNKVQKVNEYLNRPYSESTYEISKFLRDKHNLLMIASIAFAMFGGGLGSVLSLLTDSLDVALYVDEGDFFMAGLAIMFSVIPLGDLVKLYVSKNPGAKAFTKKTIIKIFEKLKLNKPLTTEEEKILKIVTDAKQVNKVFWKLINLKLTKIVYEYDVFYFVRFLLFLVKKGVIASRFLVKWGLIIGGVFYSWFKIAEFLGIKPKEEGLGKGLNENDIIESDIVNLIRNMENTNYVWSKKTSKINLPEVAAIQYVLYTGGYFSPIKPPTYQINDGFLVFNSARDVKNVKIYTSTGSLIEEVNNDGFNQFQFNKRLKNGVYIIKTTDTKNKTLTNKITYAGKSYELYTIGSTGLNVPNKISWGYYDDFTENAVKNYQEKNSLEVDGVVGSNTLKNMVKNIENNKIDGFINAHKIAKYKFSSNRVDQKVLDKKEIADAYLQQRKQTLDSLNNVFRSEVDREKQDSLSKVWEEWDFSTSETPNN
jgi:hypothetical protein